MIFSYVQRIKLAIVIRNQIHTYILFCDKIQVQMLYFLIKMPKLSTRLGRRHFRIMVYKCCRVHWGNWNRMRQNTICKPIKHIIQTHKKAHKQQLLLYHPSLEHSNKQYEHICQKTANTRLLCNYCWYRSYEVERLVNYILT